MSMSGDEYDFCSVAEKNPNYWRRCWCGWDVVGVWISGRAFSWTTKPQHHRATTGAKLPVSFHPMRLTCSKIRVCRALSPTLNGSHRLPNRHVSIVWRPDGFLRADKCRREGSLSCSSPLRMGDVDVVVHNEHTCNGKGVTDTHS